MAHSDMAHSDMAHEILLYAENKLLHWDVSIAHHESEYFRMKVEDEDDVFTLLVIFSQYKEQIDFLSGYYIPAALLQKSTVLH